jgi:hypothetical protein
VCRRFDGLFHTALSVSAAIPRSSEIQAAMAEFLVPLLSADDRGAATVG